MRTLLAAAVALGGSLAAGETRRLPVTADVGICAHRDERNLNTGARAVVRVKGDEHYYLFRFDAEPIRTWRISQATLHLKLARGRLRRAALSTVPAGWVEGTAPGTPQRGAACFTHARYGEAPWTADGGTMLDATFNSPHMAWRPAEVRVEGEWMRIAVAPELVQAVAVGLSDGLVLAEETGQTRENHDVFTREQALARPYVTVEGGPVAAPAGRPDDFAAEPFEHAADLRAGAIIVRVPLAAGKLDPPPVGARVTVRRDGQTVRQAVTLADPEVVIEGLQPQAEHDVTVEVFAGPERFVLGPLAVAASPARPAPAAPAPQVPPPLPAVHAAGAWRIELLAAAAKAPPSAAAPARPDAAIPLPVTPRNAWLSIPAVLYPPDGRAAGVSVRLTPPVRAGKPAAAGPAPRHVELCRAWYVSAAGGPQAEILVPLRGGQAIDVPWAQNKVPGQVNQQVLADVWVPPEAAPGQYDAALEVVRDGKVLAAAPVRFAVSTVALPDEFHVFGDMNTYGSPGRRLGAPEDAAAILADERKFYRLAHAHRMVLNVLPYSQSGQIGWLGAPALAGRGAACKVADWSAWDAHFGALLSGEAFAADAGYVGPGAGAPVRHMYLPFHENWPSPLAAHFRPWPPPGDYARLLAWLADLPPIERCLDGDFAAAWETVLRQFHAHLVEKGWTRTRCQVYLNNKYFFRDAVRHGGRGVSLWLLDEPQFADDFLALRYFARLTRRALEPAGEARTIDFRIDISRPTHQRDWLDGLVDLNVCADQLHAQRRHVERRRRRFGEAYIDYRMPASFGADELGWRTWALRACCWGADGTLPWQTIGADGAFDAATDTALMVPGGRVGLREPLPSLRMKAWRDGIQDAELLWMLRARRGWSDAQLRAWVGQVAGLASWRDGRDPPAEAPIVTFAGLGAEGLARLRAATLEDLSADEPPAQRTTSK